MNIEAIRLIHFMAFEDTGWIELHPITLLFGRNSSGKSAIIRALLLLKQSLDAENEEQPLAFVKEDGLVDLGSFATTVHRKPSEGPYESQKRDYLDRDIIFGFRCDLAGEPSLDQIKKMIKEAQGIAWTEEKLEQVTCVEFLIGFGLYGGAVRPSLLDLRLANSEPSICLLECRRLRDSDIQDLEGIQHSFLLNSDVVHDPQLDEQTIGLHLRDQRGFWTTFANPVPKRFSVLDQTLSVVQNGVASFLQSIVHIGPIRPWPERTYVLRTADQRRYAREGLEGWHEFLRDRVDAAQSEAIVKWMEKLGLASRIVVQADKDGQPVIRSCVLFDDKVEGINVKEVGFGASQVLPVIAAAVLSRPNAFVIIEQPELHLHPHSQAQLADLFIDCIATQRFLLETHSEHFLLRFQRRVAETTIQSSQPTNAQDRNDGHHLPSDKVVIQFVVKRDSTSRVEHIYLDEASRLFARGNDNEDRDTSAEFNEFFRTDYEDARLIGRAMSEILSKYHHKGNEARN